MSTASDRLAKLNTAVMGKGGGDRPRRPDPRTSAAMVGEIQTASSSAWTHLETLRREMEEARQNGDAVVTLPVDQITDSPFRDRSDMAFAGRDFEALIGSIRRDGQLVPILVRPTPIGEEGPPYQVVFGHRRLRALRSLGASV